MASESLITASDGVQSESATYATLGIPNPDAIPQGDRSNTAAFQQALGAAFCAQNHPGDSRYLTNPGGAGAGQGMQVACDGSNRNPIAIKFLQAKNANGSYFIPSPTNGSVQPGVTYSAPGL